MSLGINKASLYFMHYMHERNLKSGIRFGVKNHLKLNEKKVSCLHFSTLSEAEFNEELKKGYNGVVVE